MRKINLLGKPLFVRIMIVTLICLADILYSVSLIYKWKQIGILIPSTKASSNIPGILLQDLLISVVGIVIFLCSLVLLGKDFADEMYLKVKKWWQKTIVGGLGIILIGVTVFVAINRTDWITAVHNLFYYVFIIAFAEEFVFRDVSTYLLKDERTAVRYLVPNLVFAACHVFNYSGYGTLTATYILHFIRHDLVVLLFVGCFFQWLKEKSGTLWIPVLIHAIWNIILP